MKKKWIGALLCLSMTAGLLAGCGDSGTPSGSNDTQKETQKETDSQSQGSDDNGGSEESSEGKVLNIYVWNEEFKTRVKDYYPGYEEIDAKSGKIGDVTVNWNITPSDNNAYQDNLDSTLLKQKDAAADDKIDLFLGDADYIAKYVYSDYTMPLSELGIEESDLPDQYQYTHDVAKDDSGALKGVSWQACPGVLFYNREAAKEVFGSDKPEDVQEYVKDWDTFNESAKTLKEKGYNIMASANDNYRVYSNNVTSKWVIDGKINIDENLMNWVDASKEMVDKGYTGAYDLWSDDWKKGFYPEGKVFCYFGPAWLVNFSMAADTEGSIGYEGGWGATEGPQGFFWGGTWIFAATGTDNPTLVKDIMMTLTTNKEIMTDIVIDCDDFVNNKPAMEEMAKDEDYSSKILGGQNPIDIYCKGIDGLDLSNLTSYDSGCNEEFQHAMKNYFQGNATKEEALDQFYKAIVEKYPDLTY